MKINQENKRLNAENGKSISSDFHREGVPAAESIPVTKMIEVHPGAGSVKERAMCENKA